MPTIRDKFIEDALEIINKDKQVLTDWENGFVVDISFEFSKGTGQLTNHQFNTLMEIKKKVQQYTYSKTK